ncbi:hypothetical protein TA3x_005790 (plasmid) [Tundrisphaera sp. TA3]|uniref:hypothetical protein n=1 Tax=Tundrisphaera sp. TA3 TaxID=3435775 RepID=UPI003EBC44AE
MDGSLRERWRRPIIGLMVASFATLLAVPHLGRFRTPSLYSDDLLRVADLQAKPLGEVLFRPFNEHMAPWFEAVSWVVWQAAGRDLTRAPAAFTLATYVPFWLALGLMAAWLRRETGSRATALIACTAFALSSTTAECSFWFSSSSFTWALFWTLVALLGGAATGGKNAGSRVAGLFLGGMLAPASSAIGLLAGPIVATRMAVRKGDRLSALIPLAGTAAFLAVAASFRYDRVLGSGIRNPPDRLGGLFLAMQAPIARLLPGLLAGIDLDRTLPGGILLALSVAVLTLAAFVLIRDRRAGPALVALGLIVGGYVLTYPFRNSHGPRWLYAVGRFHLFPQLGLILLFALLSRRWLGRLDESWPRTLAAMNGVAAVLLLLHGGRFEREFATYHHPEQRETLAAMVRVGEACASQGIDRARCLAALDPVWCYWFQPEYNGLWLVPRFGSGMVGSDEDARRLLLGRLSDADRRALWGGMDVSARAQPIGAGGRPTLTSGHLAAGDHARPLLPAQALPQYVMTGWPAALEYRMDRYSGAEEPRFLTFRSGPLRIPIEIDWRGAGEGWSRERSIRFRADPAAGEQEWAIPLDRLPHWSKGRVEAVRVRFVAPPIAFGEPRLTR